MGQTESERKTGSSPDSSEAQIIAAMSGKGGVGKTSLLINIAHFCACNGANVLLVDCDLRTRGATAFFEVEYLRDKGKDIITTQRILASLLSDDAVNRDKEDLQKLKVINVEKNFDFVPVLVGENLIINEEKLGKDKYSSIETCFADIVAEWGKKYRYIFFDFSAGYDSIVGFFCKFASTICVIGRNNKIANEAFKVLWIRLLERYDKADVVCCTNHYKTSDLIGRGIFRDFSGFPYSREYADEYEDGIMMKWGKNNQTKEMMNIVKNLLSNYGVLLDKFDKEIHIEQRQKVEKKTPLGKIGRLEQKRKKCIVRIFKVGLFFLIILSVITLLGIRGIFSGWEIWEIIVLALFAIFFYKEIYSVRKISKKINKLLSE